MTEIVITTIILTSSTILLISAYDLVIWLSKQ